MKRAAAIRTTCPYCGVGCGVAAIPGAGRDVTIAGDEAHPANRGRLCSKGTHLAETVGLEGRLLHPNVGGERVDWDEAASLVAARFADTVERYGPDSVAFYVSGQLLTEDYYVANKLMKGFIGSANIDTNSRLCMASAVSAHVRAFGEDVVPCSYSDLDEAELIMLVGSNTAWCHPVIWQRIEAARADRGTKLVVIDPRRTETADQADLHIALSPDGDVALFNALLCAMVERGLIDEDFIARHIEMPPQFWRDLSGDAADAGLAEADFEALVDLLAAHPKMVTLFSQGVNQSLSGTDKGNAIINLHLATGRIGKSGAGPFSITGQPNAMGGRDVGGMASMLAAHMGFSDEERAAAQHYWQSPRLAPAPGLKAVDMFRAVHEGKVKALWVMGTNPAVSMPDAGFVREALERCEFLVVSDIMAQTDTLAFADVALPALGWGEKNGTVTNSERVISRQRPFFAPPGEARADWEIIADVARRMGFSDPFAFSGPAAVFREYAGQTAFRNSGRRKLDIGFLADIPDAAYDALQPFQWGGASPFDDLQFPRPGGRAAMVAVAPPGKPRDAAFPLRLNTGRYRDQWHTMTRTGLSPRLSRHRREPLIEVHPCDADARGLVDGGLARLSSAQGSSIFRVEVTDAQRRGQIFAPMHWTDDMSGGGRTNRLPGQQVDPLSGQPGFKNNAVEVEAVAADWRAFLVTRDKPVLTGLLYWTATRIDGGWLIECAGEGAVEVDRLLPEGERLEAADLSRGMRRIVVRGGDGTLAAALYLTRKGELPPRDWIAAQLVEDALEDMPALLAGRPRVAQPDQGAMVCICFDVGELRILDAARGGCSSVADIGVELRAGTNCGSCRPAIARLIADAGIERMEAAE